jgi:hypothetical protein
MTLCYVCLQREVDAPPYLCRPCGVILAFRRMQEEMVRSLQELHEIEMLEHWASVEHENTRRTNN